MSPELAPVSGVVGSSKFARMGTVIAILRMSKKQAAAAKNVDHLNFDLWAVLFLLGSASLIYCSFAKPIMSSIFLFFIC